MGTCVERETERKRREEKNDGREYTVNAVVRNLRAAEACVKASEVHGERVEKQPDALDPAPGMAPVVHG